MRLIAIILLSFVYSETIYVPEDYSTIQDAVSNSESNDTILVNDGTYYESNIAVSGRTIKSVNGPELTIINTSDYAFYFTWNGTVEGFTVTGNRGIYFDGDGGNSGGGIVRNMRFINCSPSTGSVIGGYENSSVTIERCLFVNNQVDSGAIISFTQQQSSFSYVNNCTIVNNYLGNNTVIGNGANNLIVTNTILRNNGSGPDGCCQVGFNYCWFDSDPNPLFVNPGSNDYTLQSTSPCIDAGDPNDLDPDGTIADMGAYYYHQEVSGCTDPNATNYNPEATEDDGSCCIELWGECYNINETTSLNLNNQGLTGHIPPEIGQLINLTYINLSDNQLTGVIPQEIGNVSQPWELDLALYNNQLYGLIPSMVCNLDSNLLMNNKFCPPYPTCINDEDLGYQDTSECGLGCTDISACNYDEDAIIDDDSCAYQTDCLGVCGGTAIEDCSETCQGNDYSCYGCTDPNATNYNPEATEDDGSCCIELWGECYNINETTSLNLNNQGLTGHIPPEIGQLINLTYINLSDNQLTGVIPQEIGNVSQPWELDLALYNNQLYGLIPSMVCNLDSNLLMNNKFCPPYPTCINDEDLGYQDTSECLITGDLNNDLSINVQDIIILMDIIIDIYENDYTPTVEELEVADVYEDGELNIFDIISIVNLILEQ